jgi:hypothetical protein
VAEPGDAKVFFFCRWQHHQIFSSFFALSFSRDFANQVLAPVLRKSSASEHILIMGHDDSRDYIYDAAVKVRIIPDEIVDFP